MSLVAGKVLIVTGASSGIGLATATIALDDGAQVFGVDIAPAPQSLSGRKNYEFLQINLAEDSASKAVADACVEAFGGRIDGLLNIAGVMDNNASVDTVTDEMWSRCISINLTAPTRLMSAVIPYMLKQQSGSIVNVSSKAGISGSVAGVAYTASKHGLIGVTKNVAFRFKREGIRCNAVCPGGVLTGIQSSVDPSKYDLEAMALMAPIYNLNKVGNENILILPEELAQSILFLASDRSKSTTGAIIPIDLGLSTL